MKDPKSEINWWRFFPEINPNPVFEFKLVDKTLTYANTAGKEMIQKLSSAERQQVIVNFFKVYENNLTHNHNKEGFFHIEENILGKWYDIKLKYLNTYQSLRIFFTDITLIREAKEEMKAAKLLAEESARIKSTFLANMSHEIRTPMNGIIASAQLVLEESLSPNQRELMEIIYYSADSLLHIINDVLDLSKLEAGKVTIENIAMDIKKIIRDVTLLLKLAADEKKLALNISYSSNFQPYYIGDPNRLRQILLNVVSNAIKFTEEGHVDIRVMHSVMQQQFHNIQIQVVDTGIGIPKDKLDLIFNSFSQAEAGTTRTYGGSGLGMTISRELARLMGGDLVVASEMGIGSSFTLSIPMMPTEQIHVLNATNSTKTLARSYDRKIIIAEDCKINGLVISKMLNSLGVDVQVVTSGEQLIAAMNETFDLILMDLQMPIMDGIEATKLLIASGCSAPIIALTANAMEQDRQQCIAAGMQGFLTKPLRKKDLILELDKYFLTT